MKAKSPCTPCRPSWRFLSILLLTMSLAIGLPTSSLAQEKTESTPTTSRPCKLCLTPQIAAVCEGYKQSWRACERQREAQAGAILELRKRNKEQARELFAVIDVEKRRRLEVEAQLKAIEGRFWTPARVAGVTLIGVGGVMVALLLTGDSVPVRPLIGASVAVAGGVVLVAW